MAHIVHIDLNDFLVSVERKHDPSLKDRAVVIGGQPTGWGRVVAASREAVQRGVKPGMSLSVAASRCPSAIFLNGEFDRYLDASAAIDELLREPRLPVEWTSIDSVFIDASGGANGVGGAAGGASRANARQVAERLQTALRDQLGFEAAVGIASTKIAAQIASRLARPAGLLYVLPGYEERLLAPLDVALLPDLPPGMAPKLHRASVMTLGHLVHLDLQKAEALLGRRAAEFARLARGLDDRKVDGAAPPRSVARDLTLPEATSSPAEVESIAQYLTETLAGRLRRMSCFAQTVTVRLRGGTPEKTYARSMSLREATASDGDLVIAAHALLNTLRRQVRSIAGVSVVLSNLHHGGAQLPLFALSPGASQENTGTRANNWADLRGRAGFRALVHGHFASQPSLTGLRRRAG
jgi:DNA polymerase IV